MYTSFIVQVIVVVRVTSILRLKNVSHGINGISHSEAFSLRLADYQAHASIHTPMGSMFPFSLGVHRTLKELHASENPCTKYEHFIKYWFQKPCAIHIFYGYIIQDGSFLLKGLSLLHSYLKFQQLKKAYHQKEQTRPIGEAQHLLSYGIGRSLCKAFHLDTFKLACLSKKNAIYIMDNSLEFNYFISLSL